jgi:hypothetical protein
MFFFGLPQYCRREGLNVYFNQQSTNSVEEYHYHHSYLEVISQKKNNITILKWLQRLPNGRIVGRRVRIER